MEAVTNQRHFWWQWLHGHRRSKAQNKAAAAAEARAQATKHTEYNRFDVLTEQSASQVNMRTANLALRAYHSNLSTAGGCVGTYIRDLPTKSTA